MLALKRDASVGTIRKALMQKLDNEYQVKTIEQYAIETRKLSLIYFLITCHRLGLLSDDNQIEKRSNPLDTISSYLAKRLSFGSNERDIVILHHQVGVTWSSSSTETEVKTIDMVVYGDQKYSAMAKTVGLPAAIATQMILQSKSFAPIKK